MSNAVTLPHKKKQQKNIMNLTFTPETERIFKK